MADPVTLQDIYDLFKASQADLQASREEFDRRMAESKAEADRRMAESQASREEFEQRMAKLENIAANTSREVGRLGDRWGTFVENLVEPAVLRLFQARGIDIQTTYRRAKSTRPAARMEIDILAVDGDVAVAIEVKSRLTQQDVDDLCEKLQKLKIAFPEHASHRIYGAVAAIEFVQDVDRYAYRKGLFVIRQCGDSVELANDESFQPRAW
ncbi:MAG: hypothetical protein ACHWZW_00545 [Spirulina sp.]